MAESIKLNVVSALAFVNMVHGDNNAVTWCTLVHPVVSYVTGESDLAAHHAELCNEYQDVYRDKPGLQPCRLLDHAINLIDESFLLPNHF